MKETVPPLNIAIIGCGRMGTLYGQLANEMALTRLVAICSEQPKPTAQAAAELGVPGYDGCRYREMLQAHPEIEAVVIGTPEWVHLDPVLASLDAGKHVLLEKPMAIDPVDAWRMTARAAEAGRTLMVCHSNRFNPRFALMRESVARGDIGNVMHMYARRNSLAPAVHRVLGRCPLAYWLAPHDIDMMLWTARSPVVFVSAASRSGANNDSDFILATLRFANGAVGILETSWCTPGFAGRPQNEAFVVRGDAGMVEVMGNEQGIAVYGADNTVRHPDTIFMPVIHGQTEGPYRSLLRHFAGAVRGLWAPLMSASDGAAVIEVAAAIAQSLESGQPVSVVAAQAVAVQ
ncbi:MAG: Gfo/Idh/MocA family oxidoreductase [Bryobacteraceae bacterium]